MTDVNGMVLYHEKQSMQMCLLHTLNCLFQREEFTKLDLDTIAENLNGSVWLNPHRSVFGTGNYDVNVLTAAIESRGLKLIWFDSRLSTMNIDRNKVFGYIFNVPSPSRIPFKNGRHWFTVLEIGEVGFFNFDSKLNEPMSIDNFFVFADNLLANDNQLFLVVTEENSNCMKLEN